MHLPYSSVYFLMDRGDRLFVNALTWLSWMTACVCAVGLSVYRERSSDLYHWIYYMWVVMQHLMVSPSLSTLVAAVPLQLLGFLWIRYNSDCR